MYRISIMSVVFDDAEKNLHQAMEEQKEEEEEVEEEEYIVVCENCNDVINCMKENIYCLSKKEMDMAICQYCFDDCWRELRFDGWECDDFSQQSEAEK